MSTDLDNLTIATAGKLIATRQLSPVELVDHLVRRIEALDPQLDSFLLLTAERARERAKTAEREIAAGYYRGPLHGIPYGLKDIYDVAGLASTGHSRTAMDNVAREDSIAHAKLEAAGGILMGKLATHEFAHGGPSFDLPWPPARNPWNIEHFTGGSSSGSGAAVAAGFVLAAMGSDTGGSIRGPAALSGIAGFKPTYGLVSRRGVIPNSFTFDHCGPMTWTVEDCALMLQVLAGHDAGDPASADRPVPDYAAALGGDIRGLRVGLLRHIWEEDSVVAPDMARAMEDAAGVFASLGAQVETARIQPLQDYYDVKIVIAESELFSAHQPNLMRRPGDFGLDFLGRSLAACLYSATDYANAQRRRRQLVADMAPVYDRFDVLLAPSATGPAPRLDGHKTITFWQRPNVTTPFNVTGGPALTICMGYSARGLPLGLQVVARPFAETMVLRAAHAYERATPWRARRPVLAPGKAPDRTAGPAPGPTGETPDPAIRDLALKMAGRAGLTLNETQFAMLTDAAPYALAMADRLRARYLWADEPGNIFRFAD